MRKNKVDIITLGCSKNLVDSEQLMRQFKANGYTVEHDPKKINGEIVVVNTCGFIGDAQEESINMILQLAEAKKNGNEKEYLSSTGASPLNLKFLISNVFVSRLPRRAYEFNIHKIIKTLNKKMKVIDFSIPQITNELRF